MWKLKHQFPRILITSHPASCSALSESLFNRLVRFIARMQMSFERLRSNLFFSATLILVLFSSIATSVSIISSVPEDQPVAVLAFAPLDTADSTPELLFSSVSSKRGTKGSKMEKSEISSGSFFFPLAPWEQISIKWKWRCDGFAECSQTIGNPVKTYK